ncbi:hypothetical protein [Sphingomonas lenta]|uniref:Uncharacterized protein n=1 Tax=Sphingomonas lenta TaxID=1141887 RepID=A0A2A2SKI8_9SPHN|nr:hypothetical protein [Sphingomonas lenta]PAX09743.1 hypothetical protein CKY28_03160 [Sphingomonas lenta]
MTEPTQQAARRRRWLNTTEFVAVAGLIIAALGLWNTYSDRRNAAEEKKAAAKAQAEAGRRFELRGEVAKGNRAILLLRDERHVLGDVRVTFPPALGVGAKDAVDHQIRADWFDGPLLKATDGGPDERVGRLPVLVTYSYRTDDDRTTRTAVYDLVWRTRGQFLQGRELALTDFRLREPGGSQARIDTLWKAELAR